MRYKIEQSKNKQRYWVCSDFENKIVCIFENENFNDNQTFEYLENDITLSSQELATVAQEMADWLSAFHYSKMFPANIRIRIGQRIKEMRTDMNLSIRDLSERTGINHSNISAIENGKYDIRLDTISKFENVFEKKIDFI